MVATGVNPWNMARQWHGTPCGVTQKNRHCYYATPAGVGMILVTSLPPVDTGGYHNTTPDGVSLDAPSALIIIPLLNVDSP